MVSWPREREWRFQGEGGAVAQRTTECSELISLVVIRRLKNQYCSSRAGATSGFGDSQKWDSCSFTKVIIGLFKNDCKNIYQESNKKS